MALSYQDYLRKKRIYLTDKLGRFNIDSIVENDKPFNYREHSVVDLCRDISASRALISDICLDIVDRINDFLTSHDETRFIDVKVREALGLLLKFTVKEISDDLIHVTHNLIHALQKVGSVYISDRHQCIKVYGDNYVTIKYRGVNLSVYPDNFTQTSVAAMDRIYSHIIDNYKGYHRCVSVGDDSGNLVPVLASHFKSVCGIVHSKDSYEAAAINMLNNKIVRNINSYEVAVNNMLNNKSECEIIHSVTLWSELYLADTSDTLIIINPGRKGLTENGLDAIAKLKHATDIIYMSCKISTLKKDLESLKGVCTVERIHPIDNFPFTDDYLENIVYLRRL